MWFCCWDDYDDDHGDGDGDGDGDDDDDDGDDDGYDNDEYINGGDAFDNAHVGNDDELVSVWVLTFAKDFAVVFAKAHEEGMCDV